MDMYSNCICNKYLIVPVGKNFLKNHATVTRLVQMREHLIKKVSLELKIKRFQLPQYCFERITSNAGNYKG